MRALLAWIAFFGGALVAAVTAVWLISDVPPPESPTTVLLLSLAVATFGLAAELRRDPEPMCMVIVVAGTVTAMISSAIVYYGTEPHPGAAGAAVASTLAAGAAVAYLIRARLRPEELPNTLAERYGERRILESGAVQFVVDPSAVEGGALLIRCALQNCITVDCEALISIHGPTDLLSFPELTRVAVPSCAALLVTIPVGGRGEDGRYTLVLSVRTNPSGGRRLRRGARRIHEPRMSTAWYAAALLTGTTTERGGLRFDGTISASAPEAPAAPSTVPL